MARKRIIGLVRLIVAIVFLIISVAGDGIGFGRDSGFGNQQTAATAAGRSWQSWERS